MSGGKGGYRNRYQRFNSVPEYLNSLKKPHTIYYDRTELRKIGAACGMPLSEVRIGLRQAGYELETNQHGLKFWRLKNDNMQSMRK